MAERACGRCHECCIHTPVEAFNKRAGVPCLHLNVLQECGSCGIYAERPSACATYRCSWLDGNLDEELKPDACGILLETGWIEHPKHLTMILGYENIEGAIVKHAAALKRSAKSGTIIMIVALNRDDIYSFGSADDFATYNAFIDGCRRAGGIKHQFADGVVEQYIP